jgi:hypothetical protein
MTDTSTVETAPSSERWFHGRPRSWPFFTIGSAFAAIVQVAPLLLFRRPETTGGWLALFLVSWALVATSALFRDPVLDNPFARRLAGRTDPEASGARVVYLLAVFAGIAVIWVLVTGAFSWFGAPVRPS